MKPKVKQLFSGFLSTIITVSSIQLPVSYGEGDIERYPYTFFAGASTDGAITINADNVCINGNIATNGTISSPAVNFQVNGTKSEKLNETMIQCFGIIDETFFAASEVETYFEDYFLEETNINVDTPIEAEGNINLTGNISISSGLKALHNVNLNGNVENSQYSAIYSQTGDIIIDTDNLNLNGIVYAPNGAVNISAMNLNLNSVIIIADTITITCPNLNANYNAPIGEIIGKGSKTEENNENNESNEEELELIAFGEYLEDDKLKIYWDTTVPQGSFDIQISDNGENYISIDTVNDADSYEYTLSESLTQQYIKVVETTNAGKIGESIPFLITHTDEGYDIAFLDSDEDELPDLYELRIGTQIDNADSDEDGLSDYQEAFVVGSDPTIYDSITEGLADSEADSDCDGLSNIYEITIKTNPQNSDTDEDMLSDYDEIFVYFTNPLVADSDEDGIEDGSEIKLGLDPNDPETFGIPDAEYKVKQSISSDNELLSAINTEESPYELSIEMKTNGDIEKEVNVLASGYSNVIDNDAMLGASLDISTSDMCSPEDIVIKYDIKSDYIDNTLGKYSSLAEFQGIKRLNVFKLNEEEGMLLPVNTEFSEDSTQLYAEVDELGTYCIMDMEIWLDNLGVEMPEMNTNISPLRLTYSAAANILATNNSKSKPIDMVFILQTAGNYSETFIKEKKLISELSKYVFEKYSNSAKVNFHIITYGEDANKTEFISQITTYNQLKQQLDKINYNDIQEDYCNRGKAFQYLLEHSFLNSDLYVYHFINGNSSASEYQYHRDKVIYDCDNIEYIKLNSGVFNAYSEIFPKDWQYVDDNLKKALNTAITSNNDLFTSIDNVNISVLEEHFESKKTDPIKTYSIMLPTKWKKITLKEKLIINGKTNSDTDALTDWEEVDTSRLIWHNTNSFEVPTITVSNIVKNIDRFKSKSEYKFLLDNSQKIKYLPVLSDPTMKNSDGDALNDDLDPEPLYHDPDPLKYSNVLSVEIKYIPLQEVKSLSGEIGRRLGKKWDCDVYISIIKSCDCDDDIFVINDKDNNASEVYLISEKLKKTLKSYDAGYDESLMFHLSEESAARRSWEETKALVDAGFFERDSSFYYGCWYHNYCQLINMNSYFAERIDMAWQAYIVYNAALSIYQNALIQSQNNRVIISNEEYAKVVKTNYKEIINETDTVNLYGKQARIPKQSVSDMENAANAIFEKEKLGTAKSGELAEARTYKEIIDNNLGRVESFRNGIFDYSGGKRGDQMGDIDVATDRFIIEVKNSSNAVKDSLQFDKYTDPTSRNFFNFGNKKVILYVREGGVNYNKQLFIDIQNKGVIIVDSLEKLIEVMQ